MFSDFFEFMVFDYLLVSSIYWSHLKIRRNFYDDPRKLISCPFLRVTLLSHWSLHPPPQHSSNPVDTSVCLLAGSSSIYYFRKPAKTFRKVFTPVPLVWRNGEVCLWFLGYFCRDRFDGTVESKTFSRWVGAREKRILYARFFIKQIGSSKLICALLILPEKSWLLYFWDTGAFRKILSTW